MVEAKDLRIGWKSKAPLALAWLAALLPIASAQLTAVRTNRDELSLSFLGHLSSQKLIGLPGSTHHLVFEFRNSGRSSRFRVSQESPHSFTGNLQPDQLFSLDTNQVLIISVINLVVPNLPQGSMLEFTLQVHRDGAGSKVRDIRYQMMDVHLTVQFVVGDPDVTAAADNEQPMIRVRQRSRCLVAVNHTLCGNYQWHLEYHVQDTATGLQSAHVLPLSKDSYNHPVLYKWADFAIGTKDTVEVFVDVSCCVEGIHIRAEDLAGNQADLESWQNENGCDAKAKGVPSLLVAGLVLSLVSSMLSA